MTESKSSSTPARGGWRRKLVWLAGILVVLFIVAYFVVTSSAFVKAVILPRVGIAVNAQLAVADLGLSPFSQISMRDLKVTPKDAAPLLNAGLVRARYSLFALLRGKIEIEEVTIESPTVTIVEHADGTSNLDPLLKKPETKPGGKATPAATPAKTPVVDIKRVALKNATIRRLKETKDGGRESVELTNLNITATDIKNGGRGKLELATGLAMENAGAGRADNLSATLAGDFGFDLTPELTPGAVNGKATLAVQKATGSFADAAALTASLDCQLTPTEVKQVALRFLKADATLAELRVSGPFDAARNEGRLKIELTSLDRKLLNLAGAPAGLDFGTTTINAASDVQFSKGGKEISLAGQLNLARFQVTRQGQTTPTLDLRCDYDVTLDQVAQSALLKTLNVNGTQDARPLLKAALSQPMTLAFGSTSSAVGDAALNVDLTGLNLADWRAFAADLAPAGTADLKAKLLSQQGGKQLTFDLDGDVKNLGAKLGAQSISGADVKLTARGTGADMKQFKLDSFRFDLAQQGQAALSVSGSGTFDSATSDADLQVAMQAALVRLLAMFPQPDARLSGGTVELKARIAKQQSTQTVTGQLALAGLTGSHGNLRFADFGSTVDLDVAMKDQQLEIRKASGELHEGAKPGGKFDVFGNVNLATKAGQLALKLVDFNQNGLRPFLESALGDKKLVSVSVDTAASASFAASGDVAVKGSFQLANLVVNDPKGSLPTTPLEAKAQLDAGVAKSIAQIRQCQLTLTPTERARNELNLTGNVDFSKTNAITGNVKLAADSLDVTRYYDLFGGRTTAAGSTPSNTTTAAPSENKEPDPVKLPFRDFTFEAAIGRFYLREIDAQNIQVVAKLDGSHVLLKPAQLTLNGAPVGATADLDLSVPGYKYDVAFDAKAVPLAPFVNSFVPERKGQIAGTTTANVQIKGTGVTGASLQKNLSGQFGFVSTNMNLSLANVRSPLINSVVNVIVGIPDLIRNPAATLGHWLTGSGGTWSGWADQLTAAPVDVILANGKAGDGRVILNQAEVRSRAFLAGVSGDITLDSILTNSAIRFPVNVSLSRSLSEKIGLVNANTPTNATYVAMPEFLTMKGTLGKPKHDINELALIALAAKAGGGIGKNIGGATGEKVEGVLGVVGGLLGGNKPATASTNTSPTPTTNAPPANVQQPNPVNDILNLFKKPKK